MSVPVPPDAELRCSFCGRSRFEIEHIIRGNGVCICDICVGICAEVIAEAKAEEAAAIEKQEGNPTEPQ